MKAITDLMRYVNVVAFIALAVECVVQERRRRTFRTWWASVAFGSLAALGLLGLALERTTQLSEVWIKGILVVLVLFPYFLYRFVARFERPDRLMRWTAELSTAGVVMFSLLLPSLPFPGTPEPAWLTAYRAAIVVQWTILFAIVGTRLWTAGAGEATAPRRRMRTMALGTVGLNCAVLVSEIAKQPIPLRVVLATQLLALGSAALFYIGLAPPRWLLLAWRHREEDTFRDTMGALVRADDRADVAEALLPRVGDVIGARGTALVSPEGEVIDTYGRTDEPWRIPELALALHIDDPHLQRMPLRSGTLLIWTSPYSPYFGTAELSLIEGLALFIDLALERCDLSERQRALEESLTHQAHHDELTQLPNRTLYTDRLRQALARLERRGGAVTVQFLDLDRFKDVNDMVDHAAGDALLVAVAHRLTDAVRTQDTVARFGGDEFVLLAEVRDDEEAMNLAQRLLRSFSDPFLIGGRELSVSASIGVAVTNEERDSAVLMRDADAAMYRAKDMGRARIAVFDDRLRSRAVERLELERALHRDDADAELRLFYQPVIDLTNGQVTGVEALVRWQHPRLGLLGPASFVPLAEDTDLIVLLGDWVLREACRQASVWRSDEQHPPFVTWVNVSPAQLSRGDVAASATAVLADSGLEPSALGLEITESVFVDVTERPSRAITALGEIGIALAIDDFGTGLSSVGALQHLPADVLKIDGSFVHGLGTDDNDTAIVTACLALAGALDLTVVAESIETADQRAHLLDLGCRYGQGYYFCNPLPGRDLTAYLARQGQPLTRA